MFNLLLGVVTALPPMSGALEDYVIANKAAVRFHISWSECKQVTEYW